MQQYKFRALRSDFKTNKWVYGSLITTPEGTYILEEGDSVEYSEPDYHSVGMGCGLEDRGITDRYEAMEHGFNKAVEKCCEIFPPFIPVKQETVGIWTGLKDKNGSEIYDGDIIESRGGLTVYVAWEVERAMFIYKNNYGFTAIFSGGDFVTVIGNLYDNPELVNPASGQSGINNMLDPNTQQQGAAGQAASAEVANEQATTDQVAAVEQEAQEQAMESEKGSEG